MTYHVTPRGNGRQFLLAFDQERFVDLKLLRKCVDLLRLSPPGYCLMSNHVHLVMVPRDGEALAQA